ncbi:VOC family protein [Spiractinospora alimapuensis]|uniref:VOC family protein n=1 Tax=Spiractinospora alimapuensis TaxID=2820884 RepID=UPI001F1CDB48|nr:VOC family protein [Spiractinospora alimapuensis]QVQ50551.1 VOC family protein [Spiractinospora alimapuensis]
MPTMLFVNLPVTDLDRAKAFYTELGFTKNPQFTDENAAMMAMTDAISVMLLREPFFQSFSKRDLPAPGTTGVLLAIDAPDRAGVDELVGRALASGGSPAGEPMDEGPMYQRSFYDPDGHHWEVMYMDMSQM